MSKNDCTTSASTVTGYSGDEITSVWRDSVGRFKHANVDIVVFRRNGQIFTHKVSSSGVSEVYSRFE